MSSLSRLLISLLVILFIPIFLIIMLIIAIPIIGIALFVMLVLAIVWGLFSYFTGRVKFNVVNESFTNQGTQNTKVPNNSDVFDAEYTVVDKEEGADHDSASTDSRNTDY